MKLREAVNRLPESLVGVRLRVPGDGRSAYSNQVMVLRSYSGEMAWLVRPDEWGRAIQRMYVVEASDIMDWGVIKTGWFIDNGDDVIVDATCYGLGRSERATVLHVCEGDASAYPIKVGFQCGRCGQYKRSELKLVVHRRLQDD